MKSFILFVILIIVFATQTRSQDLKPTNKTERKVVRMIQNLPEMIEDNKFMAKKGRPYITYIENAPGDLDNYYHVAVSENNGRSLVPHHRFLVNSKTFRIYYVDFWNYNFKPISLKEWRRRNAKKLQHLKYHQG